MNRRDALKALGSGSLGLAAAPLATAKQTAAGGRYQPTWDSIDQRPIPSWYSDAKVGIFIHWGVYSVPAYAAVNVKDENSYAEW